MADEDAKANDRSVSTLVEAGKTKSNSNRSTIDYCVMVRSFIKFLRRILKVCQDNQIRHTDIASNVIPALLDVILNCKWNKVSPMYIDQVVTLLGHLSVFSEKETNWIVRDLIAVVKSPWRRPLITSMLHGVEDLKIEEVFDLLAKEGLLVVNRVRSLLENKLPKLCLNYLTWVYRCFTWDKRPIENTITLPNKQFIFDIYIILLNDLKSIRDVFNVLKSFSNDEIMLMVNRLRNEHKRSNIALQVVNMLILKMSINVLESNEYILYTRLVQIFCEMSMKHNDNIAYLKKQLNSVCKLTATSDHIYAIAQELFKQFSTNREVVTYVIELYIRGLTTDANALDKAKCVLKEPETVRELGNKLSRVFQEVASIFPEYELRREFILNAFCANPCAETFKVLENVANDAPKPKPLSSLPDNCSWHTLSKSGTHLCFTCGGLFSHDDDNWVEEVPVSEEPDPTKLLDPQKTSFDPHLCDDLNVVLSSTRIQQLHWNLERNEMFTRCRNYIEQYKDLKLMLSKELEYLNIDYNQFKDMPGNNYADDPYAGVEKGYEHFIEFSDDEEEEDDEDSEEEMRSDSNRNRKIGRPRKSGDSKDSRTRKFDSDSDDYVPPGRSRKSIDSNLPKAKVGRPKKIVIENQPKPKIKIKKERIVKPPVKTVKSAALIDLTKSDSNSSDEIFYGFNSPETKNLFSGIPYNPSPFGGQSRVVPPPVTTQTPQSPRYSAIIYPKSSTITTVTSSSIHHPLMTTNIAPVSSGSSHQSLMISTTIAPVSTGSSHQSLMTSTTIAPVSTGSSHQSLMTSITIASVLSGTSDHSLITSTTITPSVSSVSLHHPLMTSTATTSVSFSSLHHPLMTSTTTVPVSITIPDTSGKSVAAPIVTTSPSSNPPNTVKSLRAFRPTIRKQEKTLYSAPLLRCKKLSFSRPHTSYESSRSTSKFSNSNQGNVNIPLNRTVGNFNPGTLAMRNYLVQKYSNIQANIPAEHAQQVSLASTTIGSMDQNLTTTSTASTMQGAGLKLSTISTTIESVAQSYNSITAESTLRTSSFNLNTISSPSTSGHSGYNLASTTVGSSGYNLNACQVTSTIADVIRIHSTPSTAATSSGLSTSVKYSQTEPQLLHSLLTSQLNKRKSDPADPNIPVKKKRVYTRRKTTVGTTSTTNTVQSVISDISFAQNQINNTQIAQIQNETRTNESNNQSLTINKMVPQHQTTKDNNESTNQQTVDSKSQMKTNEFDSKRLLVPPTFHIENQNRTKINELINQRRLFQTKLIKTNELTNVEDSLMSTLLADNTDQIENQNKTKMNESTYQQFQTSSKINNQMITNAPKPIAESTQNLLPISLPSTSIMKTKIDVCDSLNKESTKLKSNDSINVDLMSLPSIDYIQTKTSNQQFLVPSVNKTNEIETKINELTINKPFLLPSMNEIQNEMETRKIESMSKSFDSTKLFDDDDEFEEFDNLQIEKTISEIDANINDLEDFRRELEVNSTDVGSTASSTNFIIEQANNSTDVNSIATSTNFGHEQEKKSTAVDSIAPSTSSFDDTKNDQQMKQVIEILEKQSDLIATELSNDCERNVPKIQQNVIKPSIESTNNESNVIVTTADTKTSEVFEVRYHHKQVFQNNIISQIDFSDLLKSTDSAETKHRNSEFDNLFKNLNDDQQHSMKATDQNQPTHSKSEQEILHSDTTNDKELLILSPKIPFYKFTYHKTLELKKSANLKFAKVESAEVNETKEKEETKVKPSESSMTCCDSPTKFFSSVNNNPKTYPSKSSSKKLTDTKPKTTTPISSPVLSLENRKTNTGWPSPLKKESKYLFENILSTIDPVDTQKYFTSDEEIPRPPHKVFSSFREYSRDEDPATLRLVSPASIDISSRNNECDIFRNNTSESAGTNKYYSHTTFSEEIYRKPSDVCTIETSPLKVIKDTEEIPEKSEQLQSAKKLSFTNFLNKTPPKNKDPISDNTETSEDVSVSKNFEATIDKPVQEPCTSISTPKIIETIKFTKPPEKVSFSDNFRSTEAKNKPSNIQSYPVKPILNIKATGGEVQELSKIITGLNVSVSETSGTEIKSSPNVTTELKSSGLTFTSSDNYLNVAKQGNEFLYSLPISTVSPSTPQPATSYISIIRSMIAEAINKKQEEIAQNLQNQQTIHSKSVSSNTTTLPLKTSFEGKLKSILKTPINVSKTSTTTPQTVYYTTKMSTTAANVIEPGTSVVNNRPLTVKSIIIAPANILTSKCGTDGTKLGNITFLTATPMTTSNIKPTEIQVNSKAQIENTKSTEIIKPRETTTPLILRKRIAKPLTTFVKSLKIAKKSETIKQIPKSEKTLNLPSRKTLESLKINIIETDNNIEILAITDPPSSKSSSSPTTFTNILKNQKLNDRLLSKKNNSPPLPLSIDYENHEGVQQTVLIKTDNKFGSSERIQSKCSESQSSSSSSNDLDFTIVRTSNGGYEVNRTNPKSNLKMTQTVKIHYINQDNDVPDLVPIISSSKCTELGKRKLMNENQAKSLGTQRFKNNDAEEGCSGTVDFEQNVQESTGGVHQQQNNSIAATNNVSVQQPTTLPTLSTIVTSPNIVQNSLNTTNGSTVSVVRSTSAIISNSTTLSSPNTDTPTLVNMLIHRPTIRTNTSQEVPGAASSTAAARLKQIYQATVEDDSSITVNSTPVSVSNIIRATGVTANQASASIQVRGATSTSGTPHLLSFVNSSQLLKSISTSDGVKPLQLLYKISDGKTYITPVSLSASSSVKMATVNKQQTGEIVKVEVISPTTKLTPTSTSASTARSVFEETYAKFIHIGRTNQTQTVNSVSSSASENITSSTASTLPKFQQAFGKTTNFSNSQTTRNNTDQQPLLLVSKMSGGGASVVSVSSAPPSVTSTITSTTSTPITVVPVSIGTSVATSTIQRVTTNQQQVRLIKTTSSTIPASNNNKPTIENKNECNDVDSNTSNDSLPSSSASQTVSIQQSGQTSQTVLTPMRLALPIVQRTGGIPTTRVMTPVLLRQRVLLTSGAVGTPIRLPQNARVLTSNMNTLEPSVSSSTLEQLREFDKVFEKVKERSTTVQPTTSVTATTVTATVPSTTVSSTVSTNFINKIDNTNTTADTSDDSTQTSNRSSTPIMATFQTAPHIDTSNLVVGSQQQRVSVAYVSGQLGQTILSSPVVVMQQQPMSMSLASSTPSPALSVTSQSSSSSPSSSSNANNNPISSSKSTPIKLNATVATASVTAAASKTIKNKPIKPNTQASPLKASPVPKPQQKPQEDEGTAQRIYSILAEYAEQLRNSPDLNNKPAPRRRSNPPANPSQNSKRKKSSGGKKVSTSSGGTGSGMEMSPGTIDDHRTIGSEDSSCGVQLHLSQLQDSPSQAMLSMDDAQSTEGSMDIPGMRGLHGMDNSNDCMDRPSSSQSASAVSVSATSVSVPTSNAHQTPQHRQLILTDTSNSTGNRNVIITDSVVSEALAQVGKITNTATVLVPGNYLLPMSMVKGGHQITIVSGGSKILAVKPLKLPTTISNNQTAAGTSQQITTQVLVPTSNVQKISNQLLNRTVVSSSEASLIRTSQSATGILSMADGIHNRDHSNSLDFSSSGGAVLTVQSSNTKSHVTLVETNNTRNRNTAHQLQLQVNDPTTMSGSNGPLLSQLCNELNDNGNHSSGIILTDSSATNVINVSPIHNGKVDRDCIENTKNSFKKNWSSNSDTIDQHHQPGASPIFRHSPGMQYATSTIDSTQPDKKSRTINNNNQKQLSIQAQRKQAAIERELRLQKSLSEECEDLGVDEPSASDLFPEAEILFDNTNQSPSFGGNVLLQDVVTTTCSNDDENIFTNTLDNGNSRDMTTASSQDIKNKLNDHVDYLLVQKNKINKNGTTKFHGNVVAQCSNSSQSSYEDTNTLITNTPLISDVTIPSPLPQSTSYCLPSPYRAESPLTQATHSHLYTYSKKSNTKLATKKGRSYSLFESDCELSSSSHDDSNSRTSSTSADGKDNDSLSDSASEAQSDNNTRKYSRKRPYKLYVYDENGVDASSFTCDKDEAHETSTHLNNTPSSDNNEESMSAMSADMMEGLLEDSSESSPHSMLSDSDLASLSSGLRRASKRGHVRKGCQCCTTAQDTSSPPTKRKFGKKAFTQHGHAATKKIGGKKIS